MRRLIKEPLLHFFALGAVLFALHLWLRGPLAESGERIHVTAAQVDQLALGFARNWQRPPTREELAGLVDDFVREEVLYREAVGMGLDEGDTIVRRRMRQKLEFLSEDLAPIPEPDDAALSQYLAVHADTYRVAPRLALRQVFVSRDRRGDAAERDARALLAKLSADPSAALAGDPSLLPGTVALSPLPDVARTFGADFAGALLALPVGRWSGPVESGFGLHLVLVEAREEGRAPALDEVRDAVRNDWTNAQRSQANEAFYQGLRARYEVFVDPLPAVGAAAPSGAAAE